MSILDQNILVLDLWRDKVTYGKHTVPVGTLGCAALNIPDETIKALTELSKPFSKMVDMLGSGKADLTVVSKAEENLSEILQILQETEPFSLLDLETDKEEPPHLFNKKFQRGFVSYVKAQQKIGALASLQIKYRSVVAVMNLVVAFSQLGRTLEIYKTGMTDFAQVLHACDRTPEGYAAAFSRHFSSSRFLSVKDNAWMALSNSTIQYVASQIPGTEKTQLVKRMCFVSFVGLLRSDFFESLCVGHAPRRCAICGRWFLTTDARLTKYCGGLAPGDTSGRTCRQIGNLKGREQRELADDHPIKAIYNRRMNTITQYFRRGVLDEQTANMMKELAKDKMERAISDHVYAKGSYEKEMRQNALLAEVKTNR